MRGHKSHESSPWPCWLPLCQAFCLRDSGPTAGHTGEAWVQLPRTGSAPNPSVRADPGVPRPHTSPGTSWLRHRHWDGICGRDNGRGSRRGHTSRAEVSSGSPLTSEEGRWEMLALLSPLWTLCQAQEKSCLSHLATGRPLEQEGWWQLLWFPSEGGAGAREGPSAPPPTPLQLW